MKLFFASTIILFSMSLQANSNVLSEITKDQRTCVFQYDKIVSLQKEIDYQKMLYLELREKVDLSNDRLQELIERRDQSKNDCEQLRAQEKCRQASKIQGEINNMLPDHEALEEYINTLSNTKNENQRSYYKLVDDFYNLCQLKTEQEMQEAQKICSSNYGKGSNYCLVMKL